MRIDGRRQRDGYIEVEGGDGEKLTQTQKPLPRSNI